MKKIICIIILLLVGLFLYARYIGIKGLDAKEYYVVDENIPESFNGFKIVQFSDLLYGGTVDIDDINNIVKKINDYKGDIVVFTGNLINSDVKISDEEKQSIIDAFNQILYKEKKYAIYNDLDKDNSDVFKEIMQKSEFEILDKNIQLIFNSNNDALLISNENSSSKVDTSTENIDSVKYKICFISKSDDADTIKDKYNLIIAGNSLGGLIRIPFVGGLLKQDGSQKYVDDYYKISDKTSLYVSYGIGTKNIPYRAFNKPSISVYKLYNN